MVVGGAMTKSLIVVQRVLWGTRERIEAGDCHDLIYIQWLLSGSSVWKILQVLGHKGKQASQLGGCCSSPVERLLRLGPHWKHEFGE